MKAAVNAIKFFQALSGTGIRGRMMSGFFSGLLKLIHPRSKVIDDNLKLAYPDSSEEWRKDIRRKCYESLAWTLTEALALQKDTSQVLNWIKHVKGKEIIDDLIRRKQGVIFLTAHIGNWELFGSWYAQYALMNNHRLHVVYQESHDEDISRYIRQTRENGKMIMIPKDISALKMSRMLRNGEHFAILYDVSGSGELVVPFMGHNATNMAGPAMLAMMTNVPVVPAFSSRMRPFEHEAEFFEPLKLPDKNEKMSHEERMKRIIFEMNKAIERYVRRKPEQWFWLHRRWKNVT